MRRPDDERHDAAPVVDVRESAPAVAIDGARVPEGAARTEAGGRDARTRELPDEQREALRKAVFWEWFTIGYTAVTITVIAFVVSGSQAMKTAWIEDMLSLVPQFAFLVALLFVRRSPSVAFPYGLHRAMGIGHLVAGLALFAVGADLALEAVLGLLRPEHAPIGEIVVFGQRIWFGWVMIAAMALFMIGPFIYGPAKARLAPVLHNKVLYADADMAKADWTSTAASVFGVLGLGMGWWWLDGVAALFIAAGIVRDGVRNVRVAVLDLMDQRARTVDDSAPNAVIPTVLDAVRTRDWVVETGVRVRDMGQVLHLEVFVVPRAESVALSHLDELRAEIEALDWKIQEAVVVVVAAIPPGADTRDGVIT